MPVVSASWKASLPMRWVGTWPVRQTIGTESISASVRPVTALVAPGPAGHQHDADLAGRARIALGGMHRALLVAHQDVAQPVLLEERVVDRQDGAAGIAENDINALIDQGFDDHFRSRHLLAAMTRSLNPPRCALRREAAQP